MKSILLFLIIVICYSCDINNQKLLLINNTSNTIYYRLLTDTILSKELQLYKVLPYDTVKPNFVMGGKGAWEYAINKRSKDSTLHIFIFSTDKINEDIINSHRYRRFDYKLKSLDSLNWTVVYK